MGSLEFRREYLLRLPLPLAQLYSRAYNAKDARGRHDNCFYLFESLIKLAACPLIAAYARQVRSGGPGSRVKQLDEVLPQLALPSLGQWVGFTQELARYFGNLPDAASHPLGHVFEQLDRKHRQPSAILDLYRRIKNGPDNPGGQPSSDGSCSLRQLFDAIVQYRNLVFGHGASRLESFYEQEMGPLLFPAVNEILQEGNFDLLGPKGTKLVFLTDIRATGDGRLPSFEVGLRELVGTQGERMAPLPLTGEQAAGLSPNVVAVWWPGVQLLRLDPLLAFRESEVADEVLFMNRDRNGKQVEYLSYTTGRTERLKETAAALAELLSVLTPGEYTGGKGGESKGQNEVESLAESPPCIHGGLISTPSSEVPSRRLIGDYELLAEIGRGGMGVVYLARQLSLGRVVALKMLPAELAGDAVSLARFQREVRALGQCDHPNIVKLLDGGRLPDGNVYYTMEYVHGCDLEQVWRELSQSKIPGGVSTLGNTTFVSAVRSASGRKLQQVQSRYASFAQRTSPPQEPLPLDGGGWPGTAGPGEGEGPSASHTLTPAPLPSRERGEEAGLPSLPPLPLPLQLAPGEHIGGLAADDAGGYVRRICSLVRDVALALQTVHDRQVVHRDVSPANMMLTSDGSRIVLMDFGLAKGENASSAVSVQGGFAGKLRYSAPEQLAAAMVKVGPQADIRGLGVTLWELLTRRRLFDGAQDERQLAAMVLERDVPRLGEVDPTFDADLEAIVARATERSAADRIQSAEKFAEYLQLYLDDKPLPIRPPTMAELTRRWVRGHKPLVGSVSGGFALVVAVVIVAFILISGARDRAVKSAELEKAAKDQARQLAASERQAKDAARQAERVAQEQRELAVKQRAVATANLHNFITEVQQKLSNRVGMYKLREAVLKDAVDGIARLKASVHVATSQPDRDTALALLQIAELYSATGRTGESTGSLHEAEGMFARLAADRPDDEQAGKDLVEVYCALAGTYQVSGPARRAMDYAGRAQALAERVCARPGANQFPRVQALDVQGNVHKVFSRFPKAIECYKQAIDLTREMVATQPDDRKLKLNLGTLYSRLADIYSLSHQNALAGDYYQKDYDIRKVLAGDTTDRGAQRTYAIALSRLGEWCLGSGQTKAALGYQNEALDIAKTLAEGERDNTLAQDEYAAQLLRLGSIYDQINDRPRYGQALAEAVKIRRDLVDKDPLSKPARTALASTLVDHSRFLVEDGQPQEALKVALEVQGIYRQLAEADPESDLAQSDLALSYCDLGELYFQLGQVDAAVTNMDQALAINRRLESAHPDNAMMRYNLVVGLKQRGDIELKLGQKTADHARIKAAIDYFTAAGQKSQATVDADPQDFSARRMFAGSCVNLGDAQEAAGNALAASQPDLAETYLDNARKCYEQAVDQYRYLARDPDDAYAQHNVVASCLKLGDHYLVQLKFPQAEACFQQALAVATAAAAKPNNRDAQRDLSLIHLKLGVLYRYTSRGDRAVDQYRQGLALDRQAATELPKDARAQDDFFAMLVLFAEAAAQFGQKPEASEACREAFDQLDRMKQANQFREARRPFIQRLEAVAKSLRTGPTTRPASPPAGPASPPEPDF